MYKAVHRKQNTGVLVGRRQGGTCTEIVLRPPTPRAPEGAQRTHKTVHPGAEFKTSGLAHLSDSSHLLESLTDMITILESLSLKSPQPFCYFGRGHISLLHWGKRVCYIKNGKGKKVHQDLLTPIMGCINSHK